MWKFQIEILFRANEVLEIVTEDKVGNTDDIYKKKDAIAQKIIISTIDKKTFLNIMDCETSHQM